MQVPTVLMIIKIIHFHNQDDPAIKTKQMKITLQIHVHVHVHAHVKKVLNLFRTSFTYKYYSVTIYVIFQINNNNITQIEELN